VGLGFSRGFRFSRGFAWLAAALCALALLLASPPGSILSAQQRLPTGSPQRIVSLIPATTEMLFAMGAGPRVVGVGNYDRFPPAVEKLPRVGGLIDANVEALLALKPDLVIVYETQNELKQQLQRAGITMYNYSHRDLADITQTLRALGARVGAAAAAEAEAARIERRLAEIRANVAGLRRPKTLLIFGREPGTLRQINASGGYGFLHDVLELAGGTDVLTDVGKQSLMMSTEMVITRAPEVIIELHYGESLPPSQVERERRVWDALPSVPAVRNKRVYLLTGDQFVVPGPRIVLAAQQFAQVLHGQ
jgi:iron complex transport system substrate-binding protein